MDFVHPRTHVTYRAGQTDDSNSIAYELLTRAQAFAADVWQPAYDAVEADPSDNAARSALAEADRRLEQYSDLINEMRWMRSVVDWAND